MSEDQICTLDFFFTDTPPQASISSPHALQEFHCSHGLCHLHQILVPEIFRDMELECSAWGVQVMTARNLFPGGLPFRVDTAARCSIFTQSMRFKLGGEGRGGEKINSIQYKSLYH